MLKLTPCGWFLGCKGEKCCLPQGSKVVVYSRVRAVVSVSKCPWQVPTPKGVPNAKLTSWLVSWMQGSKVVAYSRVRAVVSQVSPRLPVALPSTKGASTMP
jgi:hypothetical protein